MKQGLKNLVLIACVAVLVFHFSMIVVYSLKPGKYSFFYAYPFFHQNWNLFIPPPDTNYHLYAIYENDGVKREDIFEEILTKHRHNRIAGAEPLLIALTNTIHYFEKNAETSSITTIQDGTNFLMIEQFARNYLKNKNQKEPVRLKLILTTTHVTSREMKIYHN